MLSRRFTMRLATPLLLAAILLLGCGGNLIFINLDMDSFMPVEDRSFYYILPGVFPGEVYEEYSPISDIETPEGINEVFDLQAMSLDISVELRDETWSPGVIMNLSIYVYLDDQNDPAGFWQEENRLLSLSGQHIAGVETELSDAIDVADFLELFQENELLYMGVLFTIEQDPASALGLIEGTAFITELNLHIEAREAMF